MPIKASADKLAREIQQYGNPLAFPTVQGSSGAAVMDAGCFLMESMVLLRSTILISSSSQQGLLLIFVYQQLSRCELSGNDLIGLALKHPLAFNQTMYALPMPNVLTDNGTGIVTSVPSDPSDSPDDIMALQDLVTKPALRGKYGLKDEWVLPYKVVPIIHIADFGDKSAEKIKSQRTRRSLLKQNVKKDLCPQICPPTRQGYFRKDRV